MRKLEELRFLCAALTLNVLYHSMELKVNPLFDFCVILKTKPDRRMDRHTSKSPQIFFRFGEHQHQNLRGYRVGTVTNVTLIYFFFTFLVCIYVKAMGSNPNDMIHFFSFCNDNINILLSV